MNTDTNELDVLQTLSSRVCSSKGRACGSAGGGGGSGVKLHSCMLCLHCPKCAERPGEVSCELCRECHACTRGDEGGGCNRP